VPILTYSGQEAGLLPVNGHAWKDSEQPLEQRGIEGRFFCQFFREINNYRDRMTRNHELGFSRDDVVDPPDWKPSWRDDLTSRRLVADHIFPWTKSISAPLYARIPEASRCQPNIYLSYPWHPPLLASGYGVIETVGECLKAGDCVWMDVFCHDQHRVGSAVPQIEKVIGRVQRLFLPMSEPPWFERCWCVWEVGEKLGDQ